MTNHLRQTQANIIANDDFAKGVTFVGKFLEISSHIDHHNKLNPILSITADVGDLGCAGSFMDVTGYDHVFSGTIQVNNGTISLTGGKILTCALAVKPGSCFALEGSGQLVVSATATTYEIGEYTGLADGSIVPVVAGDLPTICMFEV